MYFIFSILNILNWNILKLFLHTSIVFNWIIPTSFKLPWMEPFLPFVWTFHKLDTGFYWDRIHWHPDAGHAEAINWIVGLIMVPWSLFFSSFMWILIQLLPLLPWFTWFLVENMFIVKDCKLGFHQFCCNFWCRRFKDKFSKLINSLPVAIVIEIVTLSWEKTFKYRTI